jgi:hypothetical protein
MGDITCKNCGQTFGSVDEYNRHDCPSDEELEAAEPKNPEQY